jgi:hypothetical protein
LQNLRRLQQNISLVERLREALYVSSHSMKRLKVTILLLLISILSLGQDGSDTRYFKTGGIDSSLVGEYIQLDFYNRSFGNRKIDTVTITIEDRPIRFKEVRKDDGFNNWFSQQYLQSVDKVNNQTIRISQFKLQGVTPTSFLVTMDVEFYDANNKRLRDRFKRLKYEFDKKDIVEVLVKSRQL